MVCAMVMASLLSFMELNCENLFNCYHDSLKNDLEFTPGGKRMWTSGKYYKKLNNIAKTLISCTDERIPDLMALCEVENDSVMIHLKRRTPLKDLPYDYLMTHSRDERGIDVALIYNTLTFRPLAKQDIPIKGDFEQHVPRDILYVKGIKTGGDTLHVFVLHAPSRINGDEASVRRMATTNTLTAVIDSIYSADKNPKIVVTGDFNASAEEAPLKEIERHGMYNITREAKGCNGAKGSYCYKGFWETIDNFFISNSINLTTTKCRIHDPEFLLIEDKRYRDIKPRRSFVGLRFDPDGVSDHLPVVLSFE